MEFYQKSIDFNQKIFLCVLSCAIENYESKEISGREEIIGTKCQVEVKKKEKKRRRENEDFSKIEF